MRVSKYLENGYKSKTFDEFIFILLDKIKEFFVALFGGNLVLSNGRVLCKVLKNIEIGNMKLNKGDLVFLDPLKAVSLLTAEYITLYKLV